MAVPIMIPPSGELGGEITLLRWLARPGEQVAMGAPVAEIEADKGVLDIEAPAAGTLLAALVSEGTAAAPGAILGYLGLPGEKVAESRGESGGAHTQSPAAGGVGPPAPARGAPVTPPAGAPPEAPAGAGPGAPAWTDRDTGTGLAETPELRSSQALPQADRVPAAPATRRRAAELGVNLAAVVPTGAWSSAAGPVRVVTMRDLEEAARAGVTGARPAAGGVELRGLPANQRAVAAQVSRSHREIPPAYFRLTVDARRAVALHSEGIGYAALFVHAAARALERFPRFRDALLGEGLLTAPGVHVAFAVGLEAGGELYAPVLRDAAGLGLADLDARVRELTEAVRARRVSPDGYRGATFLVTNLGAFGVEAFDPVIHPGHSGALAVGAVRRQPVAVREGEAWRLEIRPILTLTLAVDHRLINGIEAAQALSFIRDVVERDDEGGTR